MKKILLLIYSILFVTNAFTQAFKISDFTILGNNVGKSEIKQDELKEIFKAKYNRWPNGETVAIVLPSSKSSSCDEISLWIYNTTVHGMQKFWLSLVFQGRSNAPIFTDTDIELYEYIKKNDGAIGIVYKSSDSFDKKYIIPIIE